MGYFINKTKTRLALLPVTILLLAVLIPLHAQNESKNFNKLVLDRHNYYRSIAGLSALQWSKVLEKNSAQWASSLKRNNRCRMKHSGKNFRSNKGGFSYIGENLAWRYYSGSLKIDKSTVNMSVDGWYNEIRDFQYSSRGIVCPKRGKKRATGHFTQLMWDKTTHLGCAAVSCNNDKEILLVCQYGPGGNFNIHRTPPFSPAAAKKLNAHPVNKKFGGLPSCDSSIKTKKKLDVDKIIRGLDIPEPG